MIFNVHVLFFIVIFLETLNGLPQYRYRRQVNSPNTNNPLYGQRPVLFNNPSGSNNYDARANPNYGTFVHVPNRPNGGGIAHISYDSSSNLDSHIVNPTQQRQQQNYFYNNNNNAWQKPNKNNNYNQPSNRYAPGSQGWYATGGNFWYNNGQFIIAYPYLLIINILILIICK